MSTSQSEMSSRVPPEVQAVLGEPPLLRGEDAGAYHKLRDQIAEEVEPRDLIEWWRTKDVVDHCWEIRRLRRFKALFVEIRRDMVHHNRELLAVPICEEDEYQPVPVPVSEKDSAHFFTLVANEYQSADRLIASAEARRDRTLREIERRRRQTGARLRKAAESADGEADDLPKAA
jgi:hypothetical protein